MLTIYQQPVCSPDRGEPGARSTEAERAAIAAEIAARIEEMETLKLMAGGALIAKLAAVRAISPVAFRLTTQFLSGDTSRMASYASQAERRGVSKQTVFLELRNELTKISHVFPQLVAALDALHAQAIATEQPVSRADALRASTE